MSNNAWLTPDEPGTLTYECIRLVVPANDMMRQVLRGCLRLLEIDTNWEDFGSMAAADCADWWLNCRLTSGDMDACEAAMGSIPVGGVIPWPGTALPDGYLWCHGDYCDPDDYPELFSAVGYTWGQSGDLFKLPDTRDAYPKGAASYGDPVGYIYGSNSPRAVPLLAHSHTISDIAVRSAPTGSGVYEYREITGTDKQTEETGEASPTIDVEPRRCVFEWIILAET